MKSIERRIIARTAECAKESRQSLVRKRAQLHVCGLNHVRASIELREHYALSPAQCSEFVHSLKLTGLTDQALVLSTCNRTEIYTFGHGTHFGSELREVFISIGANALPECGPPPLYQYEGMEAVRHLFAVDAGLDSMILGENQIKQQLRQAYEISRENETDGPDLHRLIESAFRTGKRIRTETDLNVGTLCVAKAAVIMGEQTLGSLAGKTCLIIGAGKIGHIAAQSIAERQPSRLLIVNRTPGHAREIAEAVGGEAYGLDKLTELLPQADFVLGAAYAPEFLLDRPACLKAFSANGGRRPVCMVDAAVPRIIDPALDEEDGIEVIDIEQMEGIITRNRKQRSKAAQIAWQIVEDEVEKFKGALHMAEFSPLMQGLREQFDKIFHEEQARLFAKLPPTTAEKMTASNRRIKQRLLHETITEIKAMILEDA